MKKFTKIVEAVEDKKHFKVSAEIDLVIPAENQGEAGITRSKMNSEISS